MQPVPASNADGDDAGPDGVRTITLARARTLIRAMAHEQSLLLLAPPGIGKSDIVFEAAREAGLPCRSLLGTQIAPEDVSGVPRIVGERSVFCPPRTLLPEDGGPFCLFLDELPACAPDVQKAFYSLLLERRIGEFALPAGSWVVAAGNRVQDRALVRSMSSALVNRVTVLNLRADVGEWLGWAAAHGVRPEVRRFVACLPESLVRPRSRGRSTSPRRAARSTPRRGARSPSGGCRRATPRCSARSPTRRPRRCASSATTWSSRRPCPRACRPGGSSSTASAST
jgi:hypothetical protein